MHEHLQSMANSKIFNSKYDVQLDLFSFYLEVTFHSIIRKGMQSLHQCNRKEKKICIMKSLLKKNWEKNQLTNLRSDF